MGYKSQKSCILPNIETGKMQLFLKKYLAECLKCLAKRLKRLAKKLIFLSNGRNATNCECSCDGFLLCLS